MSQLKFTAQIHIVGGEVVNKEGLTKEQLQLLRKEIWVIGCSKPLPGGQTEFISPFRICTVIITPTT